MKRSFLTTGALGIIAALTLSACGSSDDPQAGETTGGATENGGEIVTLKVGASITPHAKILEFVDSELAEDAGIDLEITEFEDYVLPNTNLAEGNLDANYFQHIPYLEGQIESQGYEFSHFPGIHIEPFAIYSDKHASLEEIPDGAQLGITSDVTNQGRALVLLQDAGLITLAEGVDASTALLTDVADNPKNLEFVEAEPAALVRALQDVDLAVINGNFALEAGLNPVEDSLFLESGQDNPYANIVAYRTEDEGNAALATLDELLRSEEVRGFIEENWPSGEVIPAF